MTYQFENSRHAASVLGYDYNTDGYPEAEPEERECVMVSIDDVKQILDSGVFNDVQKDVFMSTLLDIMDRQGIEYDVRAFEDLWESVLCR